MANLTEVRTEKFDELVLGSKQPVVVDFWATWCGPCKALLPKLEEIASSLAGRASVVKVNIEESPEIAQRFSVRGVPSILFFKEGELKNALSGNHSKETILETLQPLL
jgi:thioredoxin 1